MRKLMFERSEINLAKNKLTKLLRVIFYRRGITHDDFVHHHTDYFNRLHIDPMKLNHDKNNLRRTLDDPEKSTYKRFQHVIESILHLDILKITVTLRDPRTGLEETYSSDDDPE